MSAVEDERGDSDADADVCIDVDVDPEFGFDFDVGVDDAAKSEVAGGPVRLTESVGTDQSELREVDVKFTCLFLALLKVRLEGFLLPKTHATLARAQRSHVLDPVGTEHLSF